MPTDAATLGYLAGLLDGEGTIVSINKGKHWTVVIGMTDEPVIPVARFIRRWNRDHRQP